MKTQKEKWKIFWNVTSSPGAAIFSLFTVLSLIFAYFFKDNTLFSTLLTVLGSFFAGFAGSFVKDDYEKIVGQNILEKKGRSALRNLQGISTQLCNVKIWVDDFLKKTKKTEGKNILEEINRHISTIELNIASGLADWIDIVPELKEKSEKEAEIEKKYKDAAQSVMIELLEKRKELASANDEKIEQELKKKISDLEKQIKEIKKDRSQSTHGVVWGSSVLSEPINIVTSAELNNGIRLASLGSQKCIKCGKQFTRNWLSASNYGHNSYCDECSKDIGNNVFSI